MKKLLKKLTAVVSAAAVALTCVSFGGTVGLIAAAAEETVGGFTVTGGTSGTDYDYADHVLTIKTATAITISGTTTDTIVVEAGVSANITLAGVNIDVSGTGDAENEIVGSAAFKIADDSTGNVTITLADGTENKLTSGYKCAGLQKNGSGEGIGKLTIQSGENGTGKLTATGGWGGAGIGGNTSGSKIEISGGTVIAKGGSKGAGIGGGWKGSGSNITISGGTVTATCGYSGAGIGGGGNGGSGSAITITGGVVTATGDMYGAGIGGGYEGSGSDITITGGSVKAVAGSEANAIGGGYGKAAVTPTNGTNEVYLLTIANPDGADMLIDGVSYTPVNHKAVDSNDGNLYVYLPAKTVENPTVVKVGTEETKYAYDTKWLIVPTVTAPTAKTGLVYNGTAQELISAGSTDFGTLLYSLDGTNYSEDIPTATKADSYTVYYKVQGNDNVSDVDAKTVSASIGKANPAGAITRSINIVRGVGTFTEPTFTGVGGQLLDGTIVYEDIMHNNHYDYEVIVDKLRLSSDIDVDCTYTFTPKDSSNYNEVTGQINFHIYDVAFKVGDDDATVENAVTVKDNPTYGDTWEQILTLNTGLKAVLLDETVTTGFSIEISDVEDTSVDTSVKPNAGNYTYKVLFNGTICGATYTDHVVASGTVDIAQKELTVSAGTYKVSKVYDETKTVSFAIDLDDFEISGLVGADRVEINIENCGGFSSANVGTNYSVDFTISITDASGNYKLKNTTVSVPAEITAKAITPKVEGSGTHTYTGSAITPNVTVKDGETVLEEDKDYTVTVTDNINAGMATVTITAKSGGNYTFSERTLDFQIFKATPKVTAPTAKTGLVYNGTVRELISAGKTDFGTLLYSLDGTNYSENIPTATKADSYTVYYKVQGDSNVDDVLAQNFTVTIDRANPNVTAPTAKTGLVYNGTAQELISAGSTDIGTLLYSLDGTNYSTNIPTGTNAGVYTVYYKVKGDSNVNDVAAERITVSIGKVPVTITANSHTIKVDSKLPTFDYKVSGLVNNEKLPIDVNISCTASDSDTEGTYTITVSGADDSTNYTFNYVEGTLTITTKDIQTITAADVTLTYGNTSKKIGAATSGDGAISYAVKSGDDVISVAEDGTITALKAGTATVEITAADTTAYAKASKTVAVTVNKAAVTIKANSYTVKVGDALPALDFTVTGLAKDALGFTPVLTCAATDTSTAGTYAITVKFNIAEDEKYIYTAQNGTLTVQKKSTSTGGGGSSGGSGGGSSSTTSNPSIDGSAKSWSDVAADLGKLSSDSEATIELNGNTTIPVDVIKAIAEAKAVVTFKVSNVFSWTVDGSTLNGSDIKDNNFSIKEVTATGTETLRGTVGTGFTIKGTNVKSELNINFKATNAGKFANLFKKVDGKLVFVDNIKVDKNGAAIGLEVSEKGEYVAMLCDYSDRAGDMDNDGILNTKDSLSILKDFIGLEKGKNPLVADMNSDGYVNSKDALIILQKFLGIE